MRVQQRDAKQGKEETSTRISLGGGIFRAGNQHEEKKVALVGEIQGKVSTSRNSESSSGRVERRWQKKRKKGGL